MGRVTKAETVKRLREATGMGWLEAKMFLGSRSEELCERILRAYQEQSGSTLHDPIEDDPILKDKIRAVKARAEQNHREWIAERNHELCDSGYPQLIEAWPRGSCHRIWKLTKEDLQKVGISWYSPADMNPAHIFD